MSSTAGYVMLNIFNIALISHWGISALCGSKDRSGREAVRIGGPY